MSRLLNHLSSVVHVVVMLEVLNYLHCPVTPLLCPSHELLEESPLWNWPGEVHVVYCGDNFVSCLLCAEVFHFVTVLAQKVNNFLCLEVGEVKL
jgi:hypothetical protein